MVGVDGGHTQPRVLTKNSEAAKDAKQHYFMTNEALSTYFVRNVTEQQQLDHTSVVLIKTKIIATAV